MIMDKTYYTISEACDILKIKPHTIRYWETEFVKLKTKTKRGYSRRYTLKDIEFLRLIHELIYKRKFTLEGAKAEIKRMKKGFYEEELAQAPAINVTIHSEKEVFKIDPKIQPRVAISPQPAPAEDIHEEKTFTWGELQNRFLTKVKKEEVKP